MVDETMSGLVGPRRFHFEDGHVMINLSERISQSSSYITCRALPKVVRWCYEGGKP
jgi:hypothetical protein